MVGGKREGKPITLAAPAVWPARAESKPVTKPIPMSGTYSFSYTHSHTHHPSIHHYGHGSSGTGRVIASQWSVSAVYSARGVNGTRTLFARYRARQCVFLASVIYQTCSTCGYHGKLWGVRRAISTWWSQQEFLKLKYPWPQNLVFAMLIARLGSTGLASRSVPRLSSGV